MKPFSKTLILAVICCSPLIIQQTFAIDLVFEPTEVTVAELNEKPAVGTSMNHPVIFEKAKKHHAMKVMQDDYIRKHYEGYKINVDTLTINSSGRLVQGFTLKNADDKVAHVYFDVDDAYRKYKRLEDKQLAERVQKLIKTGTTGKMHEIEPDQN